MATDRAIAKVRECAGILEKEANHIGILRSVEATEAATWLRQVAEELRKVANESDNNDGKGPTGGDDHSVERRPPGSKTKARPGSVR